ncbi:NAD(P)H-dependent oxidoreductase [bacterium]|nr:NAD(P)H-dependent oxidoreductase [bacterium]
MSKVKIVVVLGTNRNERNSAMVFEWLRSVIDAREDIDPKFFDVRDFALPRDDYGMGLSGEFPDWTNAIKEMDGMVIVTPEYNHGYPGVLKSVLDLTLKPYIHKAVAITAVSRGPWGGARVVEQLVGVVRELGLAVTFSDLNVPNVEDQFNDEGKIKDADRWGKRAERMLDELVWMSRVLKHGRENVPSAYHE